MIHLLSATEIQQIYRQFVLPKLTPEYLNKYRKLPLQLNNRKWKWEGKDFPRIISLLEFREFMSRAKWEFGEVLSFNGWTDPEYDFIRCNHITNYNYEEDPIHNDLHNLQLDRCDFDFFMANQTLEHLYDPCLVFRNIYSHLKTGGIVYMNVPSNNIPHSTPFHYYTGITPVGLGCIAKQAGFTILDIGFWGNLDYYNWIFKHNDWPDFRRLRSYVNQPDRPAICWIFAQKVETSPDVTRPHSEASLPGVPG